MNTDIANKINNLLEEMYEMTKEYQSRSDFMDEYKEYFNLMRNLNKKNYLVIEMNRQKSDLISLISNTNDESIKYAMGTMVDRINTCLNKHMKA